MDQYPRIADPAQPLAAAGEELDHDMSVDHDLSVDNLCSRCASYVTNSVRQFSLPSLLFFHPTVCILGGVSANGERRAMYIRCTTAHDNRDGVTH